MALVQASASAKRQEQLAVVAAIKAHVGPAALRFSDTELLRLVRKVGSVGLACDCISAIPQPSWLKHL